MKTQEPDLFSEQEEEELTVKKLDEFYEARKEGKNKAEEFLNTGGFLNESTRNALDKAMNDSVVKKELNPIYWEDRLAPKEEEAK